jgi:hypothetical protein
VTTGLSSEGSQPIMARQSMLKTSKYFFIGKRFYESQILTIK